MLVATPRFSLSTAEAELSALRDWLAATPSCGEREIVAYLKSLTALCPLMGLYDGRKYPTAQKFEFEIARVFRADDIAGHGDHFVLIEFEGAESNCRILFQTCDDLVQHSESTLDFVRIYAPAR